jgi:hypothetical protein
MALVGCRHVIENEDETGHLERFAFGRMPTRITQDRRHVSTQQTTGGSPGNKVRRADDSPCLPGTRFRAGLLQAGNRIPDDRAIKDSINRTSKAERLGLFPVRPRCEFLLCPLIVEEHATIQIADDDTLAEVSHQRAQPAALLLERCLCCADALGDIIMLRFALGEQLIGRLRQLLEFGSLVAPHSQAGVRQRCGKLFRHAQWRLNIKRIDSDQYPARRSRGNQEHRYQLDQSVRESPAASTPVGLAGQQQGGDGSDDREHEQEHRQPCQQAFAHRLHPLYSSVFVHFRGLRTGVPRVRETPTCLSMIPWPIRYCLNRCMRLLEWFVQQAVSRMERVAVQDGSLWLEAGRIEVSHVRQAG